MKGIVCIFAVLLAFAATCLDAAPVTTESGPAPTKATAADDVHTGEGDPDSVDYEPLEYNEQEGEDEVDYEAYIEEHNGAVDPEEVEGEDVDETEAGDAEAEAGDAEAEAGDTEAEAGDAEAEAGEAEAEAGEAEAEAGDAEAEAGDAEAEAEAANMVTEPPEKFEYETYDNMDDLNFEEPDNMGDLNYEEGVIGPAEAEYVDVEGGIRK